MLIFQNAILIDGTGAPPRPGMSVLVDRDRVAAVGRGLPTPENAQVIDLTGKFLIPGLVDAHTHLGGAFRLDRPGAAGRFATYDFAENRALAMAWGVTTVRSGGDYTPDIFTFRDEVNAGSVTAPRLLACGKILQARGGHPLSTVYFDDAGVAESVCALIDEETDVDILVKEMIDLGADHIKCVAAGHNKMADPPCPVPRISLRQLRRIADAAHKYGAYLMVHVDYLSDMAQVAEFADTIEHIVGVKTPPETHTLPDGLLRALTDRGVWVVPTLVSTKRHDDPERLSCYQDASRIVRSMVEASVKLGVGCDSGIPFVPLGESLHEELELLVSCGYTPLQAITAATGGNARMCRREDFGTVQPGKAADLVVLGSDPLTDIRNTRDIRLVLRAGAVVLDRLLSR